ncbi:WGR domain-containing protein [Microvirga sp. GCM10011540]|uniref:WGR domain-containing protein n=1 Tax=Microvirga sp. GCM10011540 TaxID=3317338 RepID=UPI0036228FAA
MDDPAKNMARFYSLEVERDLLGRVVLVRRWGRIGTTGKTRLDEHRGEGEALAALQALQDAGGGTVDSLAAAKLARDCHSSPIGAHSARLRGGSGVLSGCCSALPAQQVP